MKKTSDILKAAKARIVDPKRWCQGHLFEDPETGEELGGDVDVVLGDDTKCCAMGALILSAGRNTDVSEYARYLDHAARVVLGETEWEYSIVDVNDFATRPPEWAHGKVLEAYDVAIAEAEHSEGKGETFDGSEAPY